MGSPIEIEWKLGIIKGAAMMKKNIKNILLLTLLPSSFLYSLEEQNEINQKFSPKENWGFPTNVPQLI